MSERKYFGFYWTLPVPWAGFKTLPRDVDAAARVSRTVHYQRGRVCRWVKEQGGTLIGEEAFLELEPDRGTAEITPEIERVIHRCRDQRAAIVLVDFSMVFGWRPHGPLWSAIHRADVTVHPLPPEPAMQEDGREFDPLEHFRTWSRKEEVWRASKGARKQALINTIRQMQQEQMSLEAIATLLNAQERPTLTGRLWTPDNLRKFMKSL